VGIEYQLQSVAGINKTGTWKGLIVCYGLHAGCALT
jgi:hypothetical protein